jgi:hypothetical protein
VERALVKERLKLNSTAATAEKIWLKKFQQTTAVD